MSIEPTLNFGATLIRYPNPVYDDAQAKALDAPAKAAFRRIHEALTK